MVRSRMSLRISVVALCLAIASSAGPLLVAPSAVAGGAPRAGLDNASAPEVDTSSGLLSGNPADAEGVESFLGVRYAKPPVGPLRWRAPEPAERAEGLVDATTFGDSCLAAPGPDPGLVGQALGESLPKQSEDCLTLNVWAPEKARTAGRPLPVMVWIHGGGFQFGTSAQDTYNGATLAAHGVIVVSLNYRLGVFGFLSSPQLDAESPTGRTSGNWGLMDQQLALTWVQRNIAGFGGDPSRVTLFGESAGAHSVGLQLASPGSRGLFQRVILQSGAVWDDEHGSLETHAEALARGAAFTARFAGQDLRSIPADVINANAPWDYLVTDPSVTAFSPSVDGEVLTRNPMEAIAGHDAPAVPVLGGWVGAEWFPFEARALPGVPSAAFYAAADRLFGTSCDSTVRRLYPSATPLTAESAALDLDGDMVIRAQVQEVLQTEAARGMPSWGYNFSYTSPYSPLPIHTSEVPFVFGTLTPQLTAPTNSPGPADQAMAEQMMRYWVNFARTGDPNGDGLPTWPRFGSSGDEVLDLGTPTVASPNEDRDRLAFLSRFRGADGRLPASWRTPLVTPYEGDAC